MGKKIWICCDQEFAGVAKITEHLESVHGANRPNQTPKITEEIHDQETQATHATHRPAH